jgi:DNA-binding SARP family transcriptional activator/tetratricopeptide (TPR) repeat protein
VFRLRTLGTVSLARDGVPLTGRATQRRRLALLAMLAAAGERGLTRDKVVAYLWPERDTEGARHTLSQTLYSIRQDMGDDVVLSGVDELRLNAAACESDIAEFRHAIEQDDLEGAVGLYGGPFLDGFFLADAPEFERWADEERRRLAGAYGDALESRAAELAAAGDTRRVVECWRRRAALEPLNGRVALGLMRALADAGDRAGALQHARVHALMMRAELDVDADPEVEALADRIRAERDAPPPRSVTLPQRPVSLPRPAPVTAEPPPREPVAPVPESTRRRPRWVMTAATLVLVAGIATIVASLRGTEPEAPRKLILGAMTGPDSTLALAVREALLGGLAGSPDIDVVAESRVRETLRLMRLSPDAPLTAAVATEVAQRRGAPLAIVGGVAPLGTGAQLTVRLLDAHTGAPVVTLAETPAAADEIVPAVTRLAAALRERVVGVPLARGADSLPAVSTESIDALRSYALARRALARQDREEALARLEAALVHDSTFALAHYLAGDLLWFIDRQDHSEAHLTSAYQLSDRLPPRERLIVRARYEQLILDRPDSALAAWRVLASTYPQEALAHEGMGWAYRALGRHREAAEAAARALALDSTAMAPNVNNRMFSLIALRDTTAALAFARTIPLSVSSAQIYARYAAAVLRRDWEGALAIAAEDVGPNDTLGFVRAAVWQHPVLLALGRVEEARRALALVVADDGAQNAPRALLLQGRVELALGAPAARGRELARQTLAWIEGADISPPAYARLAERTADLAARAGDRETIAALRQLIRRHDAGRGLPSYALALLTIDACDAFARGDWRAAADLAERAQRGIYFGRSVSTVGLLEADARAAAGDAQRADAIRRELLEGTSRLDNDPETLQTLAALGKLAATPPAASR